MAKIVGISGSIRRDSVNTAILTALRDRLSTDVEMHIVSLASIPLFNEDVENDPPQEVTLLREVIASSDGLIIGSPEYNHGIPGILKNALDWLSRPYGRGAMKDKPVLTFTASPAFTGGVRAHAQLNETLHALGAIRVPHPQIAIPSAHSKIGSGVFRDEETLAFILKGVEKLIHSAASTERLTMQRCA